jgi:hypothetical protein
MGPTDDELEMLDALASGKPVDPTHPAITTLVGFGMVSTDGLDLTAESITERGFAALGEHQRKRKLGPV